MESRPFPQHLDKPQRFLLWQVDEVVPAFILVSIGIAVEQITLSLIISGFSIWLLRRHRHSKPNGYLAHRAYWYGLVPLKGRQALNPFHRRIFPS